jgi:hypothetical protein
MIFRLTISGGLEGLAHQELERLFPHAHLSWNKKGNSGSQLELETDQDLDMDSVRGLHYVEYIYCQVHVRGYALKADVGGKASRESASSPEEQLLREIKETILMDLSLKRLQKAASMSRGIQHALKNFDVGLEPLPGRLLPTPVVAAAEDETNCPSTDFFQVNTIYTRNSVAKSVVETFRQLVQEELAKTTTLEGGEPEILWLDAGAGSGALWRHLPEAQRLGVDIEPTRPEIVHINFLNTTSNWLKEKVQFDFDVVCVISNPPFTDGSRGDYSAIVQFANHASRTLKARYLGLIVPCKFARQRIWTSLAMDMDLKLRGRFFLPQDSFFDPSSQKPVHIHSYFLFFERCRDFESDDFSHVVPTIKNSYYLQGKRNKGDFPSIHTADLVLAVAQGLSCTSNVNPLPRVQLVSQSQAEFALTVSLQIKTGEAELELLILLNPERPLSLANSQSCLAHQHSLGWMSMSVKPPVARAMLESTRLLEKSGDLSFLVNIMAGEGTIELEAQDFVTDAQPLFILSGDKTTSALRKTQSRLESYQQRTGKRAVVDMVLWDAQNLPLRRDIVDVFLGDLPFAGSQLKKHQAPTSHSGEQRVAGTQNLSYRSIMIQAAQVLRPHGYGALISADTKALIHATGNLNWRDVPSRGIQRIGMGGLNAQMIVMNKLDPCCKDLSVWMEADSPNLAAELLARALERLSTFYVNDMQELQENRSGRLVHGTALVNDVKLIDTYFHAQSCRLSHGYRITLDGQLTNGQAKQLEKVIRQSIEDNLLPGMISLR